MRYTMLPPLAGVLLATVSCTDQSPVGPSALATSATVSGATVASAPWARVIQGETGPGSLYALYIPENWNGEAVYYAHGIRPPLALITLDDQDNFFQVRDALGAKGYAFAYSSFSENGLAVQDGVQRTHQLRGLLESQLPSKPNRSYLAGYSLGALIALELGQKFPTQYDGILAMCGMVGGTPRELQYVGDVRALFDAYYPGVLPGSAISAPSIPLTIPQVQAAVVAAITPTAANPGAPLGLYAIASTTQTPLAFAPVGNVGDPSSPAFQSLVGSLITALYYQLLGTPDVLDRTHGHSPYDNRNVVYTMGTPVVPAPQLVPLIASMITASNQRVARFDITPDASNYLERNYVPTGSLQIPVVSVHNLWDPLVPYPIHEPPFVQAVSDAGSSAMLIPQAVPNYGHCNFPTNVVLDSFKKLTDRVNTGS
jgi:pimeloyl-ACP methyl ester carboxylesterase